MGYDEPTEEMIIAGAKALLAELHDAESPDVIGPYSAQIAARHVYMAMAEAKSRSQISPPRPEGSQT